jgi:hypothetical protein
VVENVTSFKTPLLINIQNLSDIQRMFDNETLKNMVLNDVVHRFGSHSILLTYVPAAIVPDVGNRYAPYRVI